MFSKNHPIILFLDRSGFSMFQDTLPNIVKFNFTPDIVANLDVVNKEQFSNLIAAFIQINKIVPSSLAVILSDNIVYVKDLVQSQPNPEQEHKEEIQSFLENVPFEEVLAKVIKTGETNRIVVVNRDLIMAIADVFADKGSVMEAVIPSFIFGSKANFTLGLNQDNLQTVLKEAEIIKEGNLLTDQQKAIFPQSLEGEQKEKEKKPQNIRQYILVGAFVTLLIILGVVYLNMGASQTPPARKIKSSSAVVVPTLIPTLTQEQITTVPIDFKNVKIKIVQNSESEVIGNNLKNELLKIGFEDIASEILGDTAAEKSSVIFSKTVPADVRERAFTEIKKILPDVSILENQDPDLTVTIILGKS